VSALVRGAIMEISTYRPGEKEIHRRVTTPRSLPPPIHVSWREGKGEKEISCFGPVTRSDNFSSLSMLRSAERDSPPVPPPRSPISGSKMTSRDGARSRMSYSFRSTIPRAVSSENTMTGFD